MFCNTDNKYCWLFSNATSAGDAERKFDNFNHLGAVGWVISGGSTGVALLDLGAEAMVRMR